MIDNVTKHKRICAELTELYEKKNHDYGDAFHLSYLEEGMAMPRIRIGDKFNRFKNLTKISHMSEATKVREERLRDTLIDMANYAIMTVMELDAEEGKR